ncbi:MAG: diphosphomevalonate decarboxylase [Spirochaetales bacterium]|nr:diphosphomevalonate decarboxylase [Spirochaetales bacterium]
MIWGSAKAHPSLALIKYWGKSDVIANTPATGSLAVTLDELTTLTRACVNSEPQDEIWVNGLLQPTQRFASFLNSLKAEAGLNGTFFRVESQNNFPTAAGLASSSSGFAALTGAFFALAEQLDSRLPRPSLTRMSELAREGSGSAARSIFGGFTLLDAGSRWALPLHHQDFWPDFRILIGIVSENSKAVSSRNAMEVSRKTSPYFSEWVTSSVELLQRSLESLEHRDWATLGPLIRQSYLRMFATMFTSSPPLILWQPQSVAILHTLENLRKEGANVWETMDAGPQVKIFCPADELTDIQRQLETQLPDVRWMAARPGPDIELGHGENP